MAQLSEFQHRPNQIMYIIVFLFFVLHVVQIVHFTSQKQPMFIKWEQVLGQTQRTPNAKLVIN
jgi:hypothetical protein